MFAHKSRLQAKTIDVREGGNCTNRLNRPGEPQVSKAPRGVAIATERLKFGEQSLLNGCDDSFRQ